MATDIETTDASEVPALGRPSLKITGLTLKDFEAAWIAHAIPVGGLPEVREWWERVTGSPS